MKTVDELILHSFFGGSTKFKILHCLSVRTSHVLCGRQPHTAAGAGGAAFPAPARGGQGRVRAVRVGALATF